MDITDNIYTISCNNDTEELTKYCKFLHGYIKKYISEEEKDKNNFNKEYPITGYLHYKYNIFTFPNDLIYRLYFDIKSMFYKIIQNTENNNSNYYIKGWLNYYKPNEFIDWHFHSPVEWNAWHGFYCVDCGESYTEYSNEVKDFYNDKNIRNSIIINSKNNLLVMGKSNRYHRSSKRNDNKIRITIAFDIIPSYILSKSIADLKFGWIPL
jgi:hypothetical protein